MPESICLHIQDRESDPIRVVEIPWISVRIGSAAYCEVRLAGRDLAEEACRLQRRGRTWHLVPLGPKGSILIQDQPIEGPCPLPFDVPFRDWFGLLHAATERFFRPGLGHVPNTLGRAAAGNRCP